MFYNGNSGLSENSGLEMSGLEMVGEAEGLHTAQELGPSERKDSLETTPLLGLPVR